MHAGFYLTPVDGRSRFDGRWRDDNIKITLLGGGGASRSCIRPRSSLISCNMWWGNARRENRRRWHIGRACSPIWLCSKHGIWSCFFPVFWSLPLVRLGGDLMVCGVRREGNVEEGRIAGWCFLWAAALFFLIPCVVSAKLHLWSHWYYIYALSDCAVVADYVKGDCYWTAGGVYSLKRHWGWIEEDVRFGGKT
jgi:hypothetical protein